MADCVPMYIFLVISDVLTHKMARNRRPASSWVENAYIQLLRGAQEGRKLPENSKVLTLWYYGKGHLTTALSQETCTNLPLFSMSGPASQEIT